MTRQNVTRQNVTRQIVTRKNVAEPCRTTLERNVEGPVPGQEMSGLVGLRQITKLVAI